MIQIDRLLIFNPDRWPYREGLSRCTALLIVILFVGWKLYRFDVFPQTFGDAQRFYAMLHAPSGEPLYTPGTVAWIWGIKLAVWLVETLIYVGYMAAYLTRAKAAEVAHGFMQTAFPIIVAGLPVLIAFAPYSPPRCIPSNSNGYLPFYLTVMGMIVSGGAINLVGLLTMRRAFSIMSEARCLITHGIFRIIRHPLYTGHFIMFSASLLVRLHIYTVVLFLLFVIGQVWRAHIEERKLLHAFPEYAAYRRQTGMFFPKRIKPSNRSLG